MTPITMPPLSRTGRVPARATVAAAPAQALAVPDPAPLARIAAIARRDQAAFAAFYEETLSRAWSLALRMVRRYDLAEEVVEDAYLQVWRDAARYDPQRGPPIAWLMTIVRTRALDALRRRTDEVSLDADDAAPHEPAAPDADPCDLLDAMQRQTAVAAALARLKPVQRQLLGCAFLRGMTHEEIAAAWSMPLGTVKSTIRLALLALRRHLEATS